MRALSRTIFAYTNDDRPLLDRGAAFFGDLCACASMENTRIPTAWQSEPFRLHDNLMLAGGVNHLGLLPHRRACVARRTLHVARASERCVRQAVATDKSKLLHPAPLLAFV